NPTKTCAEKNGFRHYDLIKAEHRTKGTVVGSVRSLKAKSVTLRTPSAEHFPVSYRKSKLLYRFGSVVYI
ncbi:MAG: HNH endonuclease, partial [Desulfobacteraceae bacterium]|nr:HNH endonuclease [Desulfobacteraceae bacterium]